MPAQLILDRAALPANDTLLWFQAGAPITTDPTPFHVVSVGGIGASVTTSSGEFWSEKQGNVWNGAYAPGDGIIGTGQTNPAVPIDITFAQGILGIGGQLNYNAYGVQNFDATIMTFDAKGNLLSSFVRHVSQDGQTADNTAPFIGVLDATADIYKVEFYASIPGVDNPGFALNQLSVVTGAAPPPPPPRQPPVANADSYSTAFNTALTVTGTGVLANDTDPAGLALTAAVTTGPAHGVLALNSTGAFVYTPTTGYSGADSFTYAATDTAANSAIGTVSISVGAAPPPPPPPPAAANFSITDNTTGKTTTAPGDIYTGPVAGLKFQYVYTGTNNVNVTGQAGNEFVHTGSGFDAIDFSVAGGTNVLDGGTGSNFLVGGKPGAGSDTFFVDDRAPPSDIWSTVGNFHVGDAATIFGITQTGFNFSWVDGEGAAGFQGVTLHVTAPGVPTASITLAGYSTLDLSNGRLSQSFGTLVDGTPYLYIHGDS